MSPWDKIINDARELQKQAFQPMPADQPPPPQPMVDPATGMPMDPAAMPPMDPAMAGAAMPPADPAMMGGGMPPMDPAAGGAPMDPMALIEELMAAIEEMGGMLEEMAAVQEEHSTKIAELEEALMAPEAPPAEAPQEMPGPLTDLAQPPVM